MLTAEADEPGKQSTGRMLEGMEADTLDQPLFVRIPQSMLNTETVAGIRGMVRERVKSGKPLGKIIELP